MNQHLRYQRLLLFPEEMTSAERGDVANHLLGCADCRKTESMALSTGSALNSLTPVVVPFGLRQRVLGRVAGSTPRRRRLEFGRGRWLGMAALASLAVIAWVVVAVLGQGTATTVDAYGILQRASQLANPYPYSGSARVSFTKTPWYLLPREVADYAGHHDMVTQWWVQDATHFRVDVQVFSPALERGRIVAVLDGTTLTTYDARSGRATILHRRSLAQLGMTAPRILGFLQNGAGDSLYSPSPVSPNGSLQQYVAALIADRTHPGVHPYARIVGQTRMLGRTVDIVDFGPLAVTFYDSGGCSPTAVGAPHSTPVVIPPAGPCHHYVQSMGWARVFIGHNVPLVLRFEEHGINDIENALSESINYRYQVTALRLHARPAPSLFRYRPPVSPVVDRGLRDLPSDGFTIQGQVGQSAPAFVDMPEPTTGAFAPIYSQLATTYFGLRQERDGTERLVTPPLPGVSGIDILFALDPRWTKVYTSWHGQSSIYITGRYVLAQERELATGRPAAFSAHASVQAGACRAWVGSYSDGQRWIAFQRSGISIVVSSNTLTLRQLRSYVSGSVCTR
jgi:hypothetical protein